jgi:hypothetical protein
MDEKKHLNDYVNYDRDRFDAARVQTNFKEFEASWAEQRAYLARAVRALGDSPLADEANHRLKGIEPGPPNKQGFEPVSDVAETFDTAHFAIGFDPGCGALAYLVDKKTGQSLAAGEHVLGLVGYQTFSQADYDRFLSQYHTASLDWAVLDFSKPGIAQAGAESKWWRPSLSQLFMRRDEAGVRFILELAMPEACVAKYGCPRTFTLEMDLPDQKPAIDLNLQWFQKPASRLPEAIWFSFSPRVNDPNGWMMDKMGRLISPLNVVRDGNRKLHAVGRGVFYDDGEREFSIETLDAPLVAPGEPSLLNFNSEQPSLNKGMHFNLYNNVWGTNFPMWYEEDARFRFCVSTFVK